MLDVHPPHHSPNTWRDFFLHIATIVLGLCIAIGLEQTVEFFHHRHQVAEMEEALRQESLENRHTIQADFAIVDAYTAAADRNIATLQGLSSANSAATLVLAGGTIYAPIDVAWLGMRDSALIAIVPRRLSNNYWKIDFIQQHTVSSIAEVYKLRDTILAIQRLQRSSIPISPAQRDTLLMAYSEYAQQLAHLRTFLIALDASLELALDGKELTVEASIEARRLRTPH
jgi:hypothetical protein